VGGSRVVLASTLAQDLVVVVDAGLVDGEVARLGMGGVVVPGWVCSSLPLLPPLLR